MTMGHLSLYHQEYQYLTNEQGTTNAAATAARKKLHHLRCSKPCTFPLSSVGERTNSGCGCLSHCLHGVVSTPSVEVTEAYETFDFQEGFLWPRSVQGVDHGGKPTGQTKMRCQCPVHSIIA